MSLKHRPGEDVYSNSKAYITEHVQNTLNSLWRTFRGVSIYVAVGLIFMAYTSITVSLNFLCRTDPKMCVLLLLPTPVTIPRRFIKWTEINQSMDSPWRALPLGCPLISYGVQIRGGASPRRVMKWTEIKQSMDSPWRTLQVGCSLISYAVQIRGGASPRRVIKWTEINQSVECILI